MRRLLAVTTLVGTLLIAGCSGGAPDPESTPTPIDEPAAERTEVDWAELPPGAKELIDQAEADGDCELLQGTFDVAEQAGFVDEMKYIDEALRLTGCY